MERHALRDDQFARIEHLLPGRPGTVGRNSDLGNRLFVDAVIWKFRVGTPWRDLPERFGGWCNTHKRFSRWAVSGETPGLFGVEPPRPRLEAVRIVDMSASNSWAEFAAMFRRTRPAFVEHEGAKADLKKLVPEDAKEATGHGLRAKRSKSGAISFDLVDVELADAPLQ